MNLKRSKEAFKLEESRLEASDSTKKLDMAPPGRTSKSNNIHSAIRVEVTGDYQEYRQLWWS